MLRTTVHGKWRDIGLGGLSWTSLAEAREKARELRKIARDGGDPLVERTRQRGVPTFEEAARKVHEMNRPGWRNGSDHVRNWIASLGTHVFPHIGERAISTIQSSDVLTVLTPIWHSQPETAARPAAHPADGQ